MTDLYFFLYPSCTKRFIRLVLLFISAGVITILCHGGTFFPPVYFDLEVDEYLNAIAVKGEDLSDELFLSAKTDGLSGPAPVAQDDHGVTSEEIPVTIDVLANDREGKDDDDDDDDDHGDDGRRDFRIDRTSVDLNPDADGIQSSIASQQGTYSVNRDGFVTYVPSENFFGTTSIQYTVRSKEGERSNRATITIEVFSVNDAPVITGQNAVITPEDLAITILPEHLQVADPDNTWPTGFTIQAGEGSNYTLSGLTVTPASDFSGNLSVPVTVNDGETASEVFALQITVTPENDRPVITGQSPDPLTTRQDQPLTIAIGNLYVVDPDNAFPADFTLTVHEGSSYSVSGNTITPVAGFTGTLAVNVSVRDLSENSDMYSLRASVEGNVAPLITGQNEVSTPEETAVTISLAHLLVSDTDSNYPDGFTLTLAPGANYTLDGNTVIPAVDFSGTLSVPVFVNDGTQNSNEFSLAITVTPVNDKPVVTGQAVAETTMGVGFTIELAHLTVTDPDNAYPTGFSATVYAGTNYTVSGTTVLPAPGFVGPLNVGVSVSDGLANSDIFNFQISVSAVANAAPVITGQLPLATNEEQPVSIALSHLIVTDTDNVYPTGFSLTISAGANYTVTGQTITPAPNFAGVLTVPVFVNDGISNSATFNFQLQVNQVNDPPSFAVIPDQQIAENSPGQSITITNISKGPMENDQQLTFVATSSNPAIIGHPVVQYNGIGTTATLSFSVMPNTAGNVTLTVVAVDNGPNTPPHANSYSSSFQVAVVEINNAPTLDPVSDLTIMEDSEQQNVTLTGISAGLGETQPLTLTATASRPEFFDLLQVAYTSPSANGLLQFKTAENAFGSVEVAVKVTDDGPGVSPHVNSITRRFRVVIQPTNDPPVFTSEPVTIAVVGETYEYHVTTADPDGDKVTISAPTKPSWLVMAAGNNGKPRLYGKPPQGVLGNYDVTLRANDGSVNVDQQFRIYVNVKPEVDDLAVATEEDTPFAFPANFFVAGYSDQNENSLQAIRIKALPGSGVLTVSGVQLKKDETVPASSIAQLTYTPDENFFGEDSFTWDAFDGYNFSDSPARVDVAVVPVNDPARVVLHEDTLRYEVDGEAALLSPEIDIEDPDDDTLTHASVSFYAATYRPQMDVLEFQATKNVRGRFDLQDGRLDLSGVAPVEEYRTALRSIRYTHLNTLDPILEPKGVVFLLHDGTNEGTPGEKVIVLQYTFVEFEIPSAFTPNGDMANDTWKIDRPGGGLEEMEDAIISVYNKQGVLVHRAKGFNTPWDGTMNGDLLPADTYFFTIDLRLRNRKIYKGIVTILR